MAKTQKKRTPKRSNGVHGGGGKGRPLTDVEKVNLGGGMFKDVAARWKKPVGA